MISRSHRLAMQVPEGSRLRQPPIWLRECPETRRDARLSLRRDAKLAQPPGDGRAPAPSSSSETALDRWLPLVGRVPGQKT